MKKIIFLASILIAFPVFAQNTEEISQSAVSPKGECKVFLTPYNVPEDWKKVSSCKDVKSLSFGLTPEEVLKRRRGFNLRKNGPQKQRLTRHYQNNRLGSGSWTRPRRTGGEREKPRLKKRTTSTQHFGPSKGYMKNNPYKLKRLTREERQRRRKVSAQTGTATRMVRSGYFRNQPKWEIAERSHFKRTPDFSKGRPWKSIRMTRRKRERDFRKTYEPKLRQIYRPSTEGVLGG